MSRYVSLVAIFLCALSAFAAVTQAQDYPKATGYVTDTAGVLDVGTKQGLVTLLRTLHDKTTAQVAVAVVPTTGGISAEEYAVKLFEKWGVGKKGKDNGVLLVVAVKDRTMRIEVGYGLEGAIPDARKPGTSELFPWFPLLVT